MALPNVVVLNQAIAVVGQVVSELQRIPDAVRGFVDAFNPATGERLDYAFRSLHSTVGYALEPVLMTATRIVEGFADAISGGMNRLRAPVEKVGAAFSGALQPALAAVASLFDLLADGVDALLPLLKPLGTIVEGLASLFRVTTTLLGQLGVALIEGVMAHLGDLKTATQFLAEQFVMTAGVVLHFSDALLRAAGLGDVMDRALKRLQEAARAGGRRQGAPEGFSMGGLEDVYRRRLLESARSGGKSREEETFDVWKRMEALLAELVAINRNPAAQEARDRGLQQGFRAGAGAQAFNLEALLALLRQEGRNGLQAGMRLGVPPELQNVLRQLGF